MRRLAIPRTDELGHLFLPTGLATRAQLDMAGITRRTIEVLVREGHLIRVLHGHYALGSSPPLALAAAKMGGCLTGVSLFTHLGAWRPVGEQRLHVAIPADGHWPDRDARAAAFHTSSTRQRRLFEPLDSAVAHLVAGIDRDNCVAVLDSVIRRQIMTGAEVAAALDARGTRASARIRDALSPSAESGVESLFRQYLWSRRIRCRTQVQIGHYRVDFLVGQRLVVEVVGEQFHGGALDFEADVAREAFLQGLGYLVVRVSARQVLRGGGEGLEAVVAMVRRAQHVRGPGP